MSAQGPKWHIETTLVHGAAGTGGEPGATLPPVTLSTSFAHGSAEEMEAAFAGHNEAPLYSRLQNPTVAALEQRVTEACGASGAVAVASGMTAISLGLLTLLQAGDELIASPYLFGGTYTLLTRTLAELGITTHFVDPREPGQAEALIGPRTRAVFLEAIANPAMIVPSFRAWRALCDAHGLALLVDATLLTPCLYDAKAIEADVLFFSASKYLAGAASTVGGLIVDTGRCDWPAWPGPALRDFHKGQPTAFLSKLRKRQLAAVGPCLSPMNAFLLLTGLETLPLRLERQCENAARAAAFLVEHPKVGTVLYPGLPSHPAHILSGAQFRGRFGSLLSFTLADKAACFRFLNACRLVGRVTNLGDTRTLALHPASTIYATFWKHEQEQVGVTEDLIRLSLGIEHPVDILADLEQALAAA
ncbi:MAG TPA: PLP-dependent transferase [bacterium]|nr:PLP-dependent transferase [bacterium]